MYLFSRRTVATLGRQPEAFTAAVEVADIASKIVDADVNVFAGRFGAPLGSVMWTMWADSNAEVEERTQALLSDAGYLAKVESMNGLFMVPAEDTLGRLVTAPPDAPTAKYYGVTRAAMTDGKFAEAIEHGVKIAEYTATSTGRQTAFVKASYGGFADVAWIVGFDTPADLDAFADFEVSDSGFIDLVRGAAELFVANSGHTSLVEKLN